MRIELVTLTFVKTFHDLWQFLLLFPVNLVSLYYAPLFVHLTSSDLLRKNPTQKLSDRVHASLLEAVNAFQIQEFTADYYYPSGVRQAIKIVNSLYLKHFHLFPLLFLTFALNPYRSYQFFKLNNHTFISGFAFKSLDELQN
jgi:hypothetical protein